MLGESEAGVDLVFFFFLFGIEQNGGERHFIDKEYVHTSMS